MLSPIEYVSRDGYRSRLKIPDNVTRESVDPVVALVASWEIDPAQPRFDKTPLKS